MVNTKLFLQQLLLLRVSSFRRVEPQGLAVSSVPKVRLRALDKGLRGLGPGAAIAALPISLCMPAFIDL